MVLPDQILMVTSSQIGVLETLYSVHDRHME